MLRISPLVQYLCRRIIQLFSQKTDMCFWFSHFQQILASDWFSKCFSRGRMCLYTHAILKWNRLLYSNIFAKNKNLSKLNYVPYCYHSTHAKKYIRHLFALTKVKEIDQIFQMLLLKQRTLDLSESKLESKVCKSRVDSKKKSLSTEVIVTLILKVPILKQIWIFPYINNFRDKNGFSSKSIHVIYIK